MHVMFYTKPGCLLCEETELMMQLLQEDYSLTWTNVNIEEDDTIHEKFMFNIPVIEKDGEVLLSGNFSVDDLVSVLKSNV
ncbi:glutaredoxin family protein [Sporosarcina sp. HYO08]|uniref:glutaredoxin family protein n=1 Tax=Sporosarcina sp. HYO08 TaxID=1759557 RepID=UPI0007931690|nr:glutaredoxin family protein [Sporosarcina sp. HYO08]KXH79274.1 hypothetical protein AU377_11860 [Sporosarcina sp. HYO08]